MKSLKRALLMLVQDKREEIADKERYDDEVSPSSKAKLQEEKEENGLLVQGWLPAFQACTIRRLWLVCAWV